jgi:hypothetical protein
MFIWLLVALAVSCLFLFSINRRAVEASWVSPQIPVALPATYNNASLLQFLRYKTAAQKF